MIIKTDYQQGFEKDYREMDPPPQHQNQQPGVAMFYLVKAALPLLKEGSPYY